MTMKSKTLSVLAVLLVVSAVAFVLTNRNEQLDAAQDKIVSDSNEKVVNVDDDKLVGDSNEKIASDGNDEVASDSNDKTATGGYDEAVKALIADNVAARGGADAWRAVNTLRLHGQMDLGQDLHVSYVMEQKRPDKFCLEFEFDKKTATQCVDGQNGWKLLPFMGRSSPEPMSEQELREMAAAASIDGLLFDSYQRGYKVELLGEETVDGKNTSKLQVSLPGGAVRWVYLDQETGLEVKLEAMRLLRGREQLVATYYSDWQNVDGLLIPRRQNMRAEGSKESHFITVESVSVNPPIDDSRFVLPSNPVSAQGEAGKA